MNIKRTSPESKKIAELLAGAAMVCDDCDLDLLVFFHRHPRTLLTSEQISALVGYPMNRIAESIDAFIASGLLDRTQNALHAARMYVLKLEGPSGDGPRALIEQASTREGRQRIITALRNGRSPGESPGESNAGRDKPKGKLRILKIA